MIFPVESCYYRKNEVNADGLKPHTHTTTSEIIQTYDTEGSVFINGVLTDFPNNGLFFIHGQTTHFLSPTDMDKYPHSLVILDTNELATMCRSLKMYDVFETLFTKNGGALCSLNNDDFLTAQKLIYELSKTVNLDGSLKYATQASLLTQLFEIGLRNVGNALPKSDTINNILSFINDNILKHITLADISRATHLSEYYICRTFKKHLGVTIFDYIKNRRLSIAKQELVHTDKTITEIALSCCFYDNSLFSKNFTAEFGISPSQYRKKHK